MAQDAASRVFGVVPGGDPLTVTWHPGDGGPDYALEHAGIFRAEYVGVDIEREVEVSSTSPTVDIHEADVAGGVQTSDELTAIGTRYRILDAQPDGEGMLKLFLTVLP